MSRHCFVLLALAFATVPAAEAGTYPQLTSTRYPDLDHLPADFKKPERTRYDFVDLTKLPPGAKILSAARAANGLVWLVTDRGAFRSEKDAYAPLAQGPRRLLPG